MERQSVFRSEAMRCAVYCRKSSEEGLEQEFNSLHAQREACASYIASQKHEGWELLPEEYNDGGFSGGNMKRPALTQLLADINAKKIDVVVVYKIDRMSRSIADFMKMVESFEKHSVAFVSVTQNFNTENSMGKLMLNILLSFAQFEREVTGERIRDKIAASKKKGMWMGGLCPIGYDVLEKKMLVNEEGAKTVHYIYERYLELKSVHLLKRDIDEKGLRTKIRVNETEKRSGGKCFSKGHLYRILQNRLYLGEIEHKGNVYDGEHESIIERDVFDNVQKQIEQNRVKKLGSVAAKSPCILSGKIFDDKGNQMSPKHAGTHKKSYRYYTSQAIIKGRNKEAGSLPNIPAHEIEQVVRTEIHTFLSDSNKLQPYLTAEAIERQNELLLWAAKLRFESTERERIFFQLVLDKIVVSKHSVEISLKSRTLVDLLKGEEVSSGEDDGESIILNREIELAQVRDGSKVIAGTISKGCNMYLVKAIAQSFLWHEQIISGEVRSQQEIMKREDMKSDGYVRKIMGLRFLPPHVIESILGGTHKRDWTLSSLLTSGSNR